MSVLTYAEVYATFGRRLREGVFDREEYDLAVRQFDLERCACIRGILDAGTLTEIPRLCARYPLPAGDAVQPASALIFRREGVNFNFTRCDQQRLGSREAEGLRVVDPTA